MDKAQVTIALQASELTGPLGKHVVSVFVASDAAAQHFVILDHDLGRDREVRRLVYPPGSLTSHDADFLSVCVGDAVYQYVLRYLGIRPELPIAIE